jgi:hypothetical protein
MPSLRIRHCLAMLLAPVALTLAGCGDKPADTAARAPSATTAPTSAAPLAPTYWDAIAPLLVGSYGFECERQSDAKAYHETITVNKNGKVTTSDFAEDMRDAKSLTLIRSAGDGVPSSALVAEGATTFINIFDGGTDRGLTAALQQGKTMVMCDKSMAPSSMRGKKLHQTLAATLESAPLALSCVTTGAVKQEQVDYALAGGVAKINGEQFDLNTAGREMATFTNKLGNLSYSATMNDRRKLQLTFDAAGKLKKLEGKGKHDQVYSCASK